MTAIWVDASNGAAGDMLLAALIDAGATVSAIRAGLDALRVEPIRLDVEGVRRHGFRATHVTVVAPETGTERHLADVLAIVTAARLPAPVRDLAVATFTRLAEAEARVHGTDVEEVHFHEVGALDAIADVTGCALALQDLGLLEPGAVRVVGPIAAGSGHATTAHGRMPLPAPAVLEILTAAGAPMAAHPAPMELCTPTGAALLATLATGWGPPPAMTTRAAGVGAGTRDPETHPNVVRVLLGSRAAAAETPEATPLHQPLHQVEATVDDLDPRIWPDLLDRLRS
ncbi:LarC family nickel insertion protein, partial [Actinoplanes sp. NPDC051633]|uniref:LarC family nickel insertion protein n=1 Tax=Actinoplanes sp. NPDC051633 TaxID=3155670 RepID=UPI0034363077